MEEVTRNVPEPSPYLPDIRVVVRTPYSVILDTSVKELIARDHVGLFLLRAGNRPMLTALQPGPIVLRHGHGVETYLEASWGSLTVVGNEVRIIADHVKIQGVPLDLYDEAV